MIICVLLLSENICSQELKIRDEINYGDKIYVIAESFTEDNEIYIDIIIKDKNTGTTNWDLKTELAKDKKSVGFQDVTEYRLLDLNKDGSDELLINCSVGASPYYLFGVTYLIDKKISYLPLFEIQGLTISSIDSINMIMRIDTKESPAVLGLWNEYYAKYNNGKLELVKSPVGLSIEIFNDQLYGDFITFSEGEEVCKTFQDFRKGESDYNGYFWRAIENFFNNCYMTGDDKKAYDWFTTYNDCPEKQDIGIYFTQKAEMRFKDLSKDITKIYEIKN